ncbi:hypothetical protein [Streptomyces sp. NPDC058812]|uniref:hypothetical protein n=1 Tax=unclassified Streptomyces TaxID=2593676 RepID=UPI00367C6DDD
MSGLAEPGEETQRRRSRRPGTLTVAIGVCVLAVVAGMFFLADHVGPALEVLLWVAHGVLLSALIRRLGAEESSTSAALFIVITSAMAVYVMGLARDDLTLQQRGETVTATVVEEWLDPAQGRKGRDSHYVLERQDGSPVPGPEMTATSDLYNVGQVLTVIADPEGELRPQPPGHADFTAELVGAGALSVAALGVVGWMTRRGSVAARRQDDDKARRAQEAKLRQALGTHSADRRGYIEVTPEAYPDVSHQRAARIAWEMGLRAEAVGNRGTWRFGENVIEEVPHG